MEQLQHLLAEIVILLLLARILRFQLLDDLVLDLLLDGLVLKKSTLIMDEGQEIVDAFVFVLAGADLLVVLG